MQKALDIRQAAFANKNVHVAMAHKDLAYALYAQDFSSRQFVNSLEHATKALDMMTSLMSSKHVLLASSKRVKG